MAMKRTLFIILFFTSKTLNAQFFEDFNARKGLDSHQWTGDIEAFEITGNQVLRSKTITTTSLSSQNSLAYNAFWEFGIQLDFNPSTQNQLRVYLISDSDSLKKPLNGYFLLIGESGNTDRYQLYKQKGETISLVMSSAPKARPDASKVQSRIRVTRDSVGKWSLYTAQYGEDFVFDESATDNEFIISSHFGIHCRFTSGNSDKFQFDYFQIDTLGKESSIEIPNKEDSFGKLKPSITEELLFIDTFENHLTLWKGELNKFKIEEKVLRNAEDAKSPSYVHVSNTAVRNRLWEAGLEVNGLLTTQNNIRLYLNSTNDSLPGNQQGYQLQIDGTGGNHIYKLYKQNNTSRTLLWQSVPFPTRDNKLRARVRITCNKDGEWRVYADEYDQGEFTLLNDQNGVFSIVDLSHSTSVYSGWMTRFTSTRTQDYALHYFLIKKLDVNLPDTSIPPEQESTYTAKVYDVIINEIMADQKNPIGLPEIEYIELKNLSDEDINLKGWTYSSLTRSYQFNKGRIPAKSLLILYPESDSTVIQDYDLGYSLGLSTWPPLVNSGTTLTLKNEEGLTIDEVEYKSSWYRDTKKSNGGWSLERIDPYLRCEDDENWIASIDPSGGTPGRENSVHESKAIQDLSLTDLSLSNTKQIQITFNKVLDPTSASTISNYRIDNSIGSPDSVKMISARSLILFYSYDFLGGYHYILTIENMADCMGNKIDLTKDFFIPEAIASQDILINEILFDPYKDGVEFVEIYNNSQKVLNLNTLSIGTVRESDGAILLKPISEESHLIHPSSYRLLSSNSQIVASHYPNSVVKNFIQMTSFPQLKNSNGTIVLQNGETQIDRLNYNENMHDALIANRKGVSLERTNFVRSTNESGNFKSAAATEGYATPGYENSQFKRFTEQAAEIALRSKTFSPDHDGFEDVLQIDYSFLEEEDLVATIDVYNDRGLLIKSLTRNQRLSSSGSLYWDGLMDNNQLAPVGIYILAIEVYNSRGFRKILRESCVLATKF